MSSSTFLGNSFSRQIFCMLQKLKVKQENIFSYANENIMLLNKAITLFDFLLVGNIDLLTNISRNVYYQVMVIFNLSYTISDKQ